MEYETILGDVHILLKAKCGSKRYGYDAGTNDSDWFVLTPTTDRYYTDHKTLTDWFAVSVNTLRAQWGHPLFLGDITGNCDRKGNERLCTFLAGHKHDIAYAAPGKTVIYGLEQIATGEQYGYRSPIKAGLRTAMIISHMAVRAEDPFLLSEEEKAILIRARTGEVLEEERVAIYRRTISPENIDRLMKMSDNPAIKNELFQLIEDIISKEELPC